MRTVLRLLVSTIAFAAASGSALAADYDPPIFIEQAPEYVPVEVGSGWYLRGDVTYLVSDPVYEFTLFGEEVDNNRFGGSLGFGYHLNDLLRMDVSGGLVASDQYDFDDGIDFGSADHEAWYGMANAYLDLGTVSGFTPYVGAGIGVLHTRNALELTVPGVGAFIGDDRQTELAYALNAGVNYQVADNFSIDFGYQYLASPQTDYVDVDTLTLDRGVDYHQVKLGFRYDLW